MPVLIDIDTPEHHLFAAAESNAKALSKAPEAGSISIGLINNMPDSALISTERQLFSLLNAAAGKIPVRLRLYTLRTVPRTDWGQQYTRRFYSDVGDLWHDRIDGLIVTGTEPQAPKLADEPYWGSFTEVIDWASEHTLSAVWSCLAVHGAVLYLDGIDRHQLGEKCIGVFAHSKLSDHPLIQGAPSQLRVPHSRWNEVREEALASSGYEVLTKSAVAGVDMFVKQQRKSLFVYFQGHPEYEAQSLLGEYRRDVGRFLRQETEYYPTMPKGYFDDQAVELLAAFEKHAHLDRRNELLSDFPVDRAARNLQKSWHVAATRIYRNWLLYLSRRRFQRANWPVARSDAPVE
jgi:homoserine O-succinyltransferase/O-acetyltransferase